ncbi:MAG: DUF349 domain-containing protein [Bacteroidales bacterium]|nr:DUF349 domain-containing protein [Bacteroidales bacterium]MDD4670186.1 DUF349 domain-containing protein [Bacteroidales bacterium]
MSEDLKPIAQEQQDIQEQSATVSEQVVESVNDKQIDETLTKNAPEEAPVEHVDYSDKGLKEIIDIFQELLDGDDMQKLYKNAEVLKAAFYKTLKKEKIAIGYQVPAESAGNTEAEGEDQVVSVNPFAEIERGFKDLYNRYRNARTDFMQEQEKKKDENLKIKLEIIEELKNLLESQEDLNRTFPEFRKIQDRWRAVGPVPQNKVKDIYDTYQHYVEMFYDYVKINKELRDLDFKKNLEAKEKLCEKAEALVEEENVVSAFRALQKLHEEWKEFGPVEKEYRESIWERFKIATAAINKKHQGYFESQKGNQKENFEAKSALCEKVEAISATEVKDSNTWNTLSKEIENIQKEWKKIGFASKKDNQKVYDRFRAACDTFYSRKREFYSDFKNQMQDNMDKKIALCEQAEALMESEDWKKTSDLLIELQKQWKEIGPVSRKKSEQIWKRFRAACDSFFEKRDKHFGSQDSQFEENLKKKIALIEEVNNYQPAEERAENFEALKAFQVRWNEIGFVPFKEKNKIQEAFKKALDAQFEGLRSAASEGESRISRYHRRFGETISKADRAIRTEREKLVQKFIKKEQDIATWENNMGFFSKSKNADALLEELNKKIEIAKEELSQLEEKIKSIDKQQSEE